MSSGKMLHKRNFMRTDFTKLEGTLLPIRPYLKEEDYPYVKENPFIKQSFIDQR